MASYGLNVSRRFERLVSDWWHWRLGLLSIPSLQHLCLETLTSRSLLGLSIIRFIYNPDTHIFVHPCEQLCLFSLVSAKTTLEAGLLMCELQTGTCLCLTVNHTLGRPQTWLPVRITPLIALIAFFCSIELQHCTADQKKRYSVKGMILTGHIHLYFVCFHETLLVC